MDKIGRDTGPGRVLEEVLAKPGLIVSFLLYNYNHDGNLLKPEHKQWIDKKVLPLLRRHKVHAKLMGLASKSGSADYNQQLSLERVLRVKKHLLQNGIPEAQVPGPDIRAAGENLAIGDDERDRAVKIIIGIGTKPKPLPNIPPQIFFEMCKNVIFGQCKLPEQSAPQQPSPPSGRLYKEMRIQQVGQIDVGIFKITGGTMQTYVIVDPETNKRRFFRVLGMTMGAGTPLSITDTGPENRFLVPAGTQLSDLQGRYLQLFSPVAIGTESPVNTFDIEGISSPQPLQTGFTYGLTLAGVTSGQLQAMGDEIEYTGPITDGGGVPEA